VGKLNGATKTAPDELVHISSFPPRGNQLWICALEWPPGARKKVPLKISALFYEALFCTRTQGAETPMVEVLFLAKS